MIKSKQLTPKILPCLLLFAVACSNTSDDFWADEAAVSEVKQEGLMNPVQLNPDVPSSNSQKVYSASTTSRQASNVKSPNNLLPNTEENERTDRLNSLRELIRSKGVYTPQIDDPKKENPALVELGRLLFFDKVVSGNQDVACATCHHTEFGTSDGLPTPIGIGGKALGPERSVGNAGSVIPRNAPDLFNRGSDLWETMFWDARIERTEDHFTSPAGAELPDGLSSILAVQAMFPPASTHEMRGLKGSSPVAGLPSDDFTGIWDALITQILAIPEYVKLFRDAYPEIPIETIGFEHAANAIAAFEASAFTSLETPFDHFLAGQNDALSDEQLSGAELFFGEANCAQCHSGALLTDQKTHVLAMPQLGPGKDDDRFDLGRSLVTGETTDDYAFRTPPLRNVAITAPYTHSGAYSTLREVVMHHFNPETALINYHGDGLPKRFSELLLPLELYGEAALDNLSPHLDGNTVRVAHVAKVDALVAFLHALTDENARDLSHLVPFNVPSGHHAFD